MLLSLLFMNSKLWYFCDSNSSFIIRAFVSFPLGPFSVSTFNNEKENQSVNIVVKESNNSNTNLLTLFFIKHQIMSKTCSIIFLCINSLLRKKQVFKECHE